MRARPGAAGAGLLALRAVWLPGAAAVSSSQRPRNNEQVQTQGRASHAHVRLLHRVGGQQAPYTPTGLNKSSHQPAAHLLHKVDGQQAPAHAVHEDVPSLHGSSDEGRGLGGC